MNATLRVMAATRYTHNIAMKKIRIAMDSVQEKFPSAHPLISRDFKTNGLDLFVQTMTENTNLSHPGQLNFKEIMDKFLAHVVADEHDLVKKIFPLIAGQPHDRIISITYVSLRASLSLMNHNYQFPNSTPNITPS